MIIKNKFYFWAVLWVCMIPVLGFCQEFGKNHVQYTNFDWHFIQSQHFDIYFYPGGQRAAEFVADVAETAYVSISKSWDYRLMQRLVIALYNSHNDFEQTNLNTGPPGESVGGFTEFYKNRIVIPYEGSYEQLRHVTHHELTHAVMLQMVFGAGTFSIISGIQRANIPLWFIEGLAEYESRGWDTESDMFMRDAVINGYVPNIHYLYGFLAYKGGQSVLNFIAETYGKGKIGEILNNVRYHKDVDIAFYKSLGMSIGELTVKWHKYLKGRYWQEFEVRKEPGDIAKQITSHRYDRNFINNSGELSPHGDKIAYLSDKSGYFDIYLISALDGRQICKLVSGQKSGRLEELHWLRPGITWHPQATQIAFAAKSGEQDAIHIVDVDKRKIIASHKFKLDGVYAPDWSPDGAEITFVGHGNGESDVYIYNFEYDSLRKATDDVFSDLEPRWSPDGQKIVFVSDRGQYTDPAKLPADFKIQNVNYHQFDIYIVDLHTGIIQRITETNTIEKSPVWSPDGSKIAYVSDKNGIFNIYLKDLKESKNIVLASTQKFNKSDSGLRYQENSEHPVTNVLSGVDHLSWKGERIAFTSFCNGGFDIFTLTKPENADKNILNLSFTPFAQHRFDNAPAKLSRRKNATPDTGEQKRSNKFEDFVFGEEFKKGIPVSAFSPHPHTSLNADNYRTPGGDYFVKKYRTKFSADIITAGAGYDPFFGFQGATMFSFSDLMGNHRFNILTDIFIDYKNSDFALSYAWLPCQTDYSVGIFQKNQLFFTQGRFLVRDRNFGLNIQISKPLDRYRRFSYGLNYRYIMRDQIAKLKDVAEDLDAHSTKVAVAHFAYTKDNTIWEMTAPKAGSRYNFSIETSPDLGKNGLDFRVFNLDYRTYLNFRYNYTYAFRFAAGFSSGRHKQKFFLGGTPNWMNLKFNRDVELELDDIYFSNFVSPMRGFDYYAQTGTKYFLTNFELRIPFVNYIHTTWPLPLRLANIRGILFLDLGSTWEDNFNFFTKSPGGGIKLDDVLMAFGWGARINLGFFILKYDMAWRTDLLNTNRARHLISIGLDI